MRNRNLFNEEELRDLYERQGLSQRAIAELKGCHVKTVRNYMAYYGIAGRSVYKYTKTSFSNDPIEKAYLIGFGAGDLHAQRANDSATSKTIIVACTSTVPEQIDLIQSLFAGYGGINLSIGQKQTVITCYLDQSFEFLLNREDKVADWISADGNYFAAFIAGYIDAEGCIQVKRQTCASEVIVRSYDVNILQTSRTFLQSQGVICPPVYLVKHQNDRDANGPLYHQNYWGLGIYRQQSLLRLFTLIAPYMRHPKRCRDMLAAWENIKTRSSYLEGA